MAFNKASDLLKALRAFGAAFGPASVPIANGKALELWLMMRFAQAAHTMDNWKVELCDGAGHPIAAGASFKPRGQHGKIDGADPAKPGFIRLTHTKSSGIPVVLELHDSLQWQGRSDALHECDLSVVSAQVAEALRQNGGGYPIGLPLIAVECKDKATSGPIGDVREKVARLFDLTHIKGARPHNLHRHFEPQTGAGFGQRFGGYIDAWQDGYFAIARDGGWQWGAGKLAVKYEVDLVTGIYIPTNLDTLLARFVTELATLQV